MFLTKTMKPLKQKWGFWILVIVLIAVIWSLSIYISHQREGLEGHHHHSQLKPLNTQTIAAGVFREIRITLANVLWLKVEDYFHANVTPEEHELIHPGHPEHIEGRKPLDSRRKPTTQFMPLIRIITDLDPQFINAYEVGSWWLYKKLDQTTTAITFLQEGIDQNPDKYELYSDMGKLYFHQLHDFTKAQELFAQSTCMKMDDRDRAITLEYLAFSLESTQNISDAVQVWNEVSALKIDPHSKTADGRLSALTAEMASKTKNGISQNKK